MPALPRRRMAATPQVDLLEGRLYLSPLSPGRAARARTLAQEAEVAPTGESSTRLQASRSHSSEQAAPWTRRWAWLKDTYWYVPKANLPAVVYDSETRVIAPVQDQTVFHLTGYRAGYFWGVVRSQFGGSTPSTSSVVGSVTPEGAVLLNFTSTGDSDSPSATQGIGRMRPKAGQWTMENQMFSGSGEQVQVGHWAYMVQTRPGMRSWRSLPGVGVSVPQFLAGTEGQGPRPIVSTA